MNELVGDRVQTDQQNEQDEKERHPWAKPASGKTSFEQPPSSNHGATVARQAPAVHPWRESRRAHSPVPQYSLA